MVTMNKKKLLISSLFIATVMMSMAVVPVLAKHYEVTITVKNIDTKKPVPNNLIWIYGSTDNGIKYNVRFDDYYTNKNGKVIIPIEKDSSLTDLQVYVVNGVGNPYLVSLNSKLSARLTAYVK